jgi:hypothetical protein
MERETYFFNNIREAWRILRGKPPTHVRLECVITAALAEEIERMKRDAEIETDREFIAYAVALWRWAAQRAGEGKAIVALDEQTKRYNELSLPPLVKVRFKA